MVFKRRSGFIDGKRYFSRACLWLTFIACVFIFLSVFFLFSPVKKQDGRTLEEIVSSGELVVITHKDLFCYYIYNDIKMGFEYDMAKAFAHHLGVRLRIKTADTGAQMLYDLNHGKGDLVAANLPMITEWKKDVYYSDGYMPFQRHIIVNHVNSGLQKAKDLSGKTIHLPLGSSSRKKLIQLQKQGIDFEIKFHDNASEEKLIKMVATGDIKITIARSNVAKKIRRYYPRVVVADSIGGQEYLHWAANRNSLELVKKFNQFLATFKKFGRLERIYKRYYPYMDDFDYVDIQTFHRRLKTRLPSYLSMIKKAALTYDFDWRLITAQMYQESHFNPMAVSTAGALGLMQIMPSTAEMIGTENIFDPRENINTGIQLMRLFYDYYDKAYNEDRILITLAVYNVGQGHVFDARNLARKMKLNPNHWFSLAKTLPLLEKREYHRDAKYGYCKGNEPLEYIRKIMIYYDILKHKELDFNINYTLFGEKE